MSRLRLWWLKCFHQAWEMGTQVWVGVRSQFSIHRRDNHTLSVTLGRYKLVGHLWQPSRLWCFNEIKFFIHLRWQIQIHEDNLTLNWKVINLNFKKSIVISEQPEVHVLYLLKYYKLYFKDIFMPPLHVNHTLQHSYTKTTYISNSFCLKASISIPSSRFTKNILLMNIKIIHNFEAFKYFTPKRQTI